jgi:MFS family permease
LKAHVSTPPAVSRQQLHAMTGVYAVLLLLGLETTLGGAILPQAAQTLNGIEHFGWLGTFQMLAAACMTPVTARLGDIWRRKWLVFVSVVLLVAAGGTAAAATSMEVLLASRIINGIAIGMMAGAAFAVPVDVFSDPSQRVRWQSLSGVMFAVSSSMGPILGALLIDLFGWRFALLAVPVACLPVLCVLLSMPDMQPRQASKQRFDLRGAVYLSLFIGSSLFGLQSLGKSQSAAGYLLVAVLSLYLFWRQQRRAEQPILALEILQNLQVKLIALSTLVSGAVLSVLLFYSPLLLTTLTAMSFRDAGLAMLPMLIGMPAGSVANGFLFRKLSRPRVLFCVGAATLFCGMAVLVFIPYGLPTSGLMAGYALCGLGLGFINQNQSVFIQIVTPRQFAGAATGLVSTVRSYGGALGSAALSLALLTAGLHQGLIIGLLISLGCALLVIPITVRIFLDASA